MKYMYFDESIRDVGDFIIGALVLSNVDLSTEVRDRWRSMGIDPEVSEYKSSHLKASDPLGQRQRDMLWDVLNSCDLAVTVCPRSHREALGSYCSALVVQLHETGLLPSREHGLYIDQGIAVAESDRNALDEHGVTSHGDQNSCAVAGLQVADHAAHVLGGMLLEEMGLLRKTVLAGENSGYDPDLAIELGFELWAGLRHALLGKNVEIDGLSTPGDPVSPYFQIEGYGLYIAPSCGQELAAHARRRFGTNYLGCIH